MQGQVKLGCLCAAERCQVLHLESRCCPLRSLWPLLGRYGNTWVEGKWAGTSQYSHGAGWVYAAGARARETQPVFLLGCWRQQRGHLLVRAAASRSPFDALRVAAHTPGPRPHLPYPQRHWLHEHRRVGPNGPRLLQDSAGCRRRGAGRPGAAAGLLRGQHRGRPDGPPLDERCVAFALWVGRGADGAAGGRLAGAFGGPLGCSPCWLPAVRVVAWSLSRWLGASQRHART